MRDAVVVGSGPNGLAAAIELARAGLPVHVLEASDTIGGGTRSRELTVPGAVHDVCSAVHPLALSSPFFSAQPLAAHGLEWVHPPAPLAHPLDDGTAVTLERSLEATVSGLGGDARAYGRLIAPFAERWSTLAAEILAPAHWPRHPWLLARFGRLGLRSARAVWRSAFEHEPARALFAGLAAHSVLPLDRRPTAAFGLVLAAAAHAVGWPFARGGSQRIADALAGRLRSLGGEISTDSRVRSLDDLPGADTVLLDVTPGQVLRIAGDRLPRRYRRALARFRYGAGVFKIDWALSSPIPWTARACERAGTVHLGGRADEIAAAEHAVGAGRSAERPFVLLAQPSRFDADRAPAGTHTAWAYCHVPHGSTADMTDRIEAQVERFAPGFRDTIIARAARGPAALERDNPNLVGGDITGGSQELRQLFTRPVVRRTPYATPVPGLYLCSASTPPGGGVHGMCGAHAARAALRARRRGRRPASNRRSGGFRE